MSYPGPRKPIIVPIPQSHITQNGISAVGNTDSAILKINFTNEGFDFYRNSIFPYIWQGYQVKVRCCPVRYRPLTTTLTTTFQTIQLDFIVRGADPNGAGGNAGIYASFPGSQTTIGGLAKWNSPLYTENGIQYSYFSYVIYP